MNVLTSPRSGVRLATHTSLKVGGPADWYAEPRTTDELRGVLEWAANQAIPFKLLGGGSNLLVSDDGVEGLVIRPSLQSHEIAEDADGATVRASAGANMGVLARTLARAGWSGLEWAATVPGCVGGAVVNNAGAFGSCVSESLISVELLIVNPVTTARPSPFHGRLVTRELGVRELAYVYRGSLLKRGGLPGAVVLSARFRIHRATPETARRTIDEFQARRTASQPRQLSAGSVFANPENDFSGRLLEVAGAKGLRVGGAEISAHHANFIVNQGQATARDVYALVRSAQDLVWSRFHIWLHPEIELVGRWSAAERAALLQPGEAR